MGVGVLLVQCVVGVGGEGVFVKFLNFTFFVGATCRSLALDSTRKFLFIAQDHAGVKFVNISDVRNPNAIVSYSLPGTVFCLCLHAFPPNSVLSVRSPLYNR